MTRHFPKKVLADRWARQVEEELASLAVAPEAGRTLLSALIDRYLEQFTPRKRASQSETSHLRIVSSHLGHLSMAELRPASIIEYVDARLETVGPDTVRKELNKLSVVIDAAIAVWGVDLAANPVHTAKSALKVTKTLAPGRRRDRRVSPDEMALLCGSRMGALIEFAVETAMRRGELARMRWGDVDDDVLHIPRTKTDVARSIPLSTRARSILGAQDRGDGGLVWGLRPDSITQAFDRVCVANEIMGLRFHDLRHEGTSRFFERGLSIQEVAAITGHADWASLKRYTHLCPRVLAGRVG